MFTLLKVIILIIGIIIVFFLFFPINYRLDGGYRDNLWFNFDINSLFFIVVNGKWNSEIGKPFQTRIKFFGFAFHLTNEGKKDDKKKKKKKKEFEEVKGEKKYNLSKIFCSLDSELMGNAIRLLKEIIYILKPDKCALKGKLGFSEPHLNGYLTALTFMKKESIPGLELDIEPYWEEEHYDLSLTVEGKIVLSVLFFKLGRFLLAKRSRQFIKDLKKAKRADSKAANA